MNQAIASRVIEAFNGELGEDRKRIADEGLAWIDLVIRKNADYGSSAWKTPVLRPAMPCGEAILVRMSDKISRLASLSTKDESLVAESFDDTIRDLGAYCLLYLARPLPAE